MPCDFPFHSPEGLPLSRPMIEATMRLARMRDAADKWNAAQEARIAFEDAMAKMPDIPVDSWAKMIADALEKRLGRVSAAAVAARIDHHAYMSERSPR